MIAEQFPTPDDYIGTMENANALAPGTLAFKAWQSHKMLEWALKTSVRFSTWPCLADTPEESFHECPRGNITIFWYHNDNPRRSFVVRHEVADNVAMAKLVFESEAMLVYAAARGGLIDESTGKVRHDFWLDWPDPAGRHYLINTLHREPRALFDGPVEKTLLLLELEAPQMFKAWQMKTGQNEKGL